MSRLGTSYEAACGDDGKGGRAATLNGLFDEWNDQREGEPSEQGKIARYGTDRLAVPAIQDGEGLY